MQKLLNLLVLALGVIAALRKVNSGLKEKAAAAPTGEESEEQTQRNEELEEESEEADRLSNELAKQLDKEPSVPSVNPETYEKTSEPTAPLSDLAMREHQSSGTGAHAAPPPKEKDEEEQKEEEQTVEQLVDENTHSQLVEKAESLGLDSSGNKTEIATRIIDQRNNRS